MSFKEKLDEKCENSSIYVPKTVNDLENILKTIDVGRLEQPVRIWTDYERINKTHFWSSTAKHWWNHINHRDDFQRIWEFKDSVLFSGHQKLHNFTPSQLGCCVCVTDLQMKLPLKCLIFCLLASFIFAIGGVIFRRVISKML